MSSKRRTLALVIPWFGHDLKGGAEQQAWQIATRLAARGHRVEALTTRCRSFLDDWAENHLPAGETIEDGVTIRRFPVDQRDQTRFERLNAELLALPRDRLKPGAPPTEPEWGAIWTHENIHSQALYRYLDQQRATDTVFLFIPYLYGPTLTGLPQVADRAWLQPCLHDEAYAYLPEVSHVFHQARGLLFNSAGEQQLAARLYGPHVWARSLVTGEGIEFTGIADDYRASLPESLRSQPFLLCLGRRDPEKGVERLIDAFHRFRAAQPASPLALALAGPGVRDYGDPAAGVIDLGLVDESTKAALLQGCRLLCQPSTNESFSRVLFEAWYCGKPVIVHRDCLATALAVRDADGGWLAGPVAEWTERLAELTTLPATELAERGERGKQYALTHCDWEQVIDRYEQALGLIASDAQSAVSLASGALSRQPAIHQLLPNLSYGDAISNQALQLRDQLRIQGYRSNILVRFIDPRVAGECQRYTEGDLAPEDGLFYHHSIGSELTPVAVAHSGPKCLIYHNITPAEFLTPYRPDLARLLREGREALWRLAPAFPYSVGDSYYNAEELALFGFSEPGVLPLIIDPGHWRVPADLALMRQLQDGQRNLLFVGRYAPNKCQHQLIEAFTHYLRMDPQARLILIGGGEPEDPYARYLQSMINAMGLREQVVLPGQINDAELQAYYRTAHLFWSMSEHEGFCVPLIEAMWFDAPILAFHSSAVPETLAGSGVLFTDKGDLAAVAMLAQQLAGDDALRSTVLEKQRQRRWAFAPEAIRPRLIELLAGLAPADTGCAHA
ncbi:MAG: glycosyltransferase [Candidatus Competibacteraceae bacterium]|nr:glycosyltransferase [Candidatus Competibacteraceae bacterium]